jgi:hypothetical protein
MLRPGQKITGTIEGGQDGSGKFNYACSLSIDDQNQSDTKLTLNDIPELVYAVCAVESYGVKSHPSDYPSAPITMTDAGLQVQHSSVNPIQWAESKKLGADYNAKSSMGGQKIEFKVA